jgi:hypothetical protein
MSILIIILLVTSGLIGLMCLIWMLVLGFQRHWGWGLAMLIPILARLFNLLPSPGGYEHLQVADYSLQLISLIVYVSFLVVAWPDTKAPFFWQLTGWLLLALALGLFISSHTPPDPRLQAVLNKQGVKPPMLDWLRAKQEGSNRFRPPGARTTWDQTRGSRDGTAPPIPTPPPVFRSRLPPPRAASSQREPAQPGIYYLLERVTTKTAKGVQAGLPGEKVILLERLSGGRMKVTVGDADFIVHSSQLTDDVNVARELEKQDFVARGGQL